MNKVHVKKNDQVVVISGPKDGDKAIKGDYALMIDEAHNLFPRAQDMLSAQLSERSLRLVRRALKEWVGKENEVYKALSDVIRVMCRLNRELDAPEWFDAQFTGCDAIAPQLNSMLTDVEDLPRINELAQSLQELKAGGQLKIQSCGQCDAV